MVTNNKSISNCSVVFALLIAFSSCVPNEPPPCLNCTTLQDIYPAWSPDGTQVALVHTDSLQSKSGIFILSLLLNKATQIVPGLGLGSPDWSPDGNWITFVKSAEIWKVNVHDSTQIQLTQTGYDMFPSWNHDGTWIAFESQTSLTDTIKSIWKIKPDGSSRMILASDPARSLRMPSWAAENMIVHIRDIGNNRDVYAMDTLGENVVRITNDSTTNNLPKYSESAGKVAYGSAYLSFYIKLINLDGTEGIILTDESSLFCDWNPTGDSIVYSNAESTNGRLWIIAKDGSKKRQVTFKEMF